MRLAHCMRVQGCNSESSNDWAYDIFKFFQHCARYRSAPLTACACVSVARSGLPLQTKRGLARAAALQFVKALLLCAQTASYQALV